MKNVIDIWNSLHEWAMTEIYNNANDVRYCKGVSATVAYVGDTVLKAVKEALEEEHRHLLAERDKLRAECANKEET